MGTSHQCASTFQCCCVSVLEWSLVSCWVLPTLGWGILLPAGAAVERGTSPAWDALIPPSGTCLFSDLPLRGNRNPISCDK